MAGLVWLPAGLRRQSYVLLLALGTLGLLSLLTDDTRALVSGRAPAIVALPSAVAPATSRTSFTPLIAGTTNMDGFGSFSPDGKSYAFMRDGQIWISGAEGKSPQALSKNGSDWDAAPAWRPDGKAIAFVRILPQAGGARIITVETGTGQEVPLLTAGEPVGYLAWTRDGRSLLFSTATALMRLDPATRKAEPLFTLKAGWEMLAGGLAVSPDGKSVVFGAGPREGRSVYYDLWSLPLGGAAPAEAERLTKSGGIMPAFDVAGRRLAYRNPRQETGIWLMDLPAHTARLLVPDGGKAMYFHPAFAPDGRRLTVSQLQMEDGNQGERLISRILTLPLQN